MPKEIATIGVYGTTESSFFRALQEFGTTHFVDIRRRRGMRGSKYAYANSSALQRSLTALDINYLHDVQLAPSNETRNVQKAADEREGVLKQSRVGLSLEYVRRYKKECLDSCDFEAFLRRFPDDAKIVLFCVEKNPEACHRSLVAEELARFDGGVWRDITP